MASFTFGTGATTSSALDLTIFADIGRQRLNMLVFPASWLAATVSFMSSSDLGATYQPVYLPGGTLYSITAGASDEVVVDLGVTASLTNIKLVSSVAQSGGPTVTAILVEPGDAAGLGGGTGASGGGSGSGTGSTFYAGQAKITVTGTAVQLPTNTLANSVTLTANGGYTYNGSPVAANSGAIFVGISGVNTTGGGTGTGFPLAPGASVTLPLSSENLIYINGAAGDWISFVGA